MTIVSLFSKLIGAKKQMAVVAKWLTHRIVAPTFVGSIPISRPIIIIVNWAMAKWLRHRTLTPRPVVQIYLAQPIYDPLAQSVEHLTFNQRVRRSSRLRVTIFIFYAGMAKLADALDLGSSS